MKKIIIVAFLLSFPLISFGFLGSRDISAERTSEGRVQAMEQVEERIRRIEEINPEINVSRLREVIRNLLERDSVCYEFKREIGYRDEGEDVRALHEILQKEGYFRGNVSGPYGWDTARALYDYQIRKGIETDSDMEKMGFTMGEEVRRVISEEYRCEEEKVQEIDDMRGCRRDSDCEWISVNCCPENAGAKWECVNSDYVDNCSDRLDIMCPQVISPRPGTTCTCEDDKCVGESNRSGVSERDDQSTSIR